MRYARKVDGNTKTISDAFKSLGCHVHQTNGDWDLTVQFGVAVRATALVEIKDPEQKANKGARVRRSANQKKVHAVMAVRIVKTLDDVLDAVDELRRQHNRIMGG